MSASSLLDLNDQDIASLSRLFGLLGEPTRVRILFLLCRGEMNVSRLCESLGLAQPTVSHHLGLLRRGGLLSSRRAGKAIHYALNGHIEFAEGCELRIHSPSGVRVRIIR
jgi:DNA-binding transcriptional ArsR family regulator